MAATQERDVQRGYWLEHSAQPTVEAMMLDSKAADIDKHERPEVLATLGPVAGKRVLELGAGIGRFTGELAARAAHVTACDFMQVSIDENRRRHGHLPNVDFAVADVTELDLPAGAFDVVFSNWLLMYLSDAEVAALAAKALTWLSEGGVLFFRESCFRQSGDRARKANPTHYRNPREYFAMFDAAEQALPGRSPPASAHFELVNCKCIDTYVALKRNQNQICWKWRKVVTPVPRQPLYRQFLDGQQYSQKAIARYEAMFGPGFISVGGAEVTAELSEALDLQPGQVVLDMGCGVGGGAFLLCERYGVHVHALDLSVNCVLAALERAAARAFAAKDAAAAVAAAAAASGDANGTAAAAPAETANGHAKGAAAANGAGADAASSEAAAAAVAADASAARANNVTFEVADVLGRDFEPGSFDAAISRDALLHVHDKPALFARLRRWLKPGARLLISDYCSGDGPSGASEALAAYAKARAYQLLPPQEYAALLRGAGFEDVVVEDRTEQFQQCLSTELARLKANAGPFVQQFGQEGYDQVAGSWAAKLARAAAGEQRWAVFTARAPLAAAAAQ